MRGGNALGFTSGGYDIVSSSDDEDREAFEQSDEMETFVFTTKAPKDKSETSSSKVAKEKISSKNKQETHSSSKQYKHVAECSSTVESEVRVQGITQNVVRVERNTQGNTQRVEHQMEEVVEAKHIFDVDMAPVKEFTVDIEDVIENTENRESRSRTSSGSSFDVISDTELEARRISDTELEARNDSDIEEGTLTL